MTSNAFQNMAPNAQRSFLVTLCLATVAILTYLFAVQPATVSLAKARTRLAELQDREQRMNQDLRNADNVKKTLAELNACLKPFNDAMLTPLLESYAMRAKSILDPLVIGAGLTDAEYTDEPFRALPVPKPLPRQLHTRAAIRVRARGSYQAAVSFLMRLEKEMPLVSLQSLAITAQNDPAVQEVVLILEWPTKGKVTRK